MIYRKIYRNNADLIREINVTIFYFHSNVIPSKEALLLAAKWYRNDKFHYIVYGLGLGYHVIELIN